jgi:OOP family OmpA-OmpF porin
MVFKRLILGAVMKSLAVLGLAVFLGSASVAMAQAPSKPPAAPAQPAQPTSGDYADALMNLDCPSCEGKVESLRGFSLATPSANRPTGAAAPSAAAGPSAQRRPSAAPTRLATAGAAPAPRVSAGDLKLTFRLGSAELTEEGAANARSFAAALSDPRLAGLSFEIIGHTDATGAPDRNLLLSEQRAESVKAFLVKQGIDAGRLQAKGVGSQDLAVPSSPAAAANRRVEVKRAG